VLELGSGFGYSAVWWALGAPDAEIHCTEYRDEHIALGRRFAAEAGVADRLHWHQGEALALAESLPGPWDLVFCDVDKKDYPRAFALAAERLAPGGMLVFDNALRNGDVALAPGHQTPPVAAVVELTRMLYADARFDVSLLPVRDGVLLALLRDGA
jgi:caffeoyl-CoA O-methyltransferase